jgi:hypothetical protein
MKNVVRKRLRLLRSGCLLSKLNSWWFLSCNHTAWLDQTYSIVLLTGPLTNRSKTDEVKQEPGNVGRDLSCAGDGSDFFPQYAPKHILAVPRMLTSMYSFCSIIQSPVTPQFWG